MRRWTDMTAIELDHYRQIAGLTDSERQVFDLRARGQSITQVSMALNLSEATVNRRIRSIKDKLTRF